MLFLLLASPKVRTRQQGRMPTLLMAHGPRHTPRHSFEIYNSFLPVESVEVMT